jgi:hypothetical protein
MVTGECQHDPQSLEANVGIVAEQHIHCCYNSQLGCSRSFVTVRKRAAEGRKVWLVVLRSIFCGLALRLVDTCLAPTIQHLLKLCNRCSNVYQYPHCQGRKSVENSNCENCFVVWVNVRLVGREISSYEQTNYIQTFGWGFKWKSCCAEYQILPCHFFFFTKTAVPWLTLLSDGLLLRKARLKPRSVHVGFVVDKEARGQLSSRVLLSCPVSINHTSFIRHRRYIIF